MNKIQINFNNLHLTEPCAMYMASFRDAIAEYRKHSVIDFNYPKVNTRKEISVFLNQLDNERRGIKIPENCVPSSAFWLVDGKNYLGSGDIRHYLNDNLRRLGGNIGYSIRPAAWRLGLGTLQLALLLHESKKLNIYKPLITCYESNIASAKVIENNGGILLEIKNNILNGIERPTKIYQIILNTEY